MFFPFVFTDLPLVQSEATSVAHQKLRVFLGIDIVGHDCNVVFFALGVAQGQRQRGLARPSRPKLRTERSKNYSNRRAA